MDFYESGVNLTSGFLLRFISTIKVNELNDTKRYNMNNMKTYFIRHTKGLDVDKNTLRSLWDKCNHNLL